jgi:GTPase Era involved in 16S rRNA processing
MDAVVGAFLSLLLARLPTMQRHRKLSFMKGRNSVEQALPDANYDEGGSLRPYTLAKQEVAASVRAAKQFFQSHGVQEAAERYQELVVQLAEDRFNLAVVGQFKRGKSTLMNAVIGRDLLPTGLLPLTSAITTLCYGSKERVMLRRQGWAWEQEVLLAQLETFITERGNPGNEKGLLEARVELPVPFLRRGLHFIDTPGIGSARHENTATTYAFLPQMNAVVFVTSVEAPLSEAEERFLSDIRGQVRQLFVVVNKIDLLGNTEREEVLNYIQLRMEELLGTGVAHLMPLSARDGLTAKLNHDTAGFQQSGLAAFEQTLTRFLAEQQGRTFLVSILDHALQHLAEAASALVHISSNSESEQSEDVLELRQTIESLRSSLLNGAPLSAIHHAREVATATPQVIDQAIAASQSPTRKATSEQANARLWTCSICAAQGQALFTFFAQWQYLLATDKMAQRAFVAERGLCPIHTWQFQEMASPQGISEGYAPLIEALESELSRVIERSVERAAAPLADLLGSETRCAACQVVRKTASEQIEHLLARMGTEEGRADYASSAGLCLPHIQATLARLELGTQETSERSVVARFLLSEQVRRLADLADDLRSYALKRDALRRGLLHHEEETAWRRALVQLAGERAARGGAMLADPGTV